MLKPYFSWSTRKYDIGRMLDNVMLWIAYRLPSRFRMWVVICAANYSIFNLHPRKDGYAGPDGLTFQEIYDGALREASFEMSSQDPVDK